ncbi:MAG: DUF2004 domain-containing protein [Candidatus Lokiarchaeota archaeon]|nr:DUF2004 domain-containing protein [Candidatus Lokiarchaeota archaeon]
MPWVDATKKFYIKYFGEIDLESVGEHLDTEIVIDGRRVSVDINFNKKKSLNLRVLEVIQDVLASLDEVMKMNDNAIKNDFENGGEVKFYVDFHLEEFEESELREILGNPDENIAKEIQILSKLKLVRIGFYPEENSSFVVMDYTISKTHTDELVVIKLDRNKNIEEIVIES